MPRIEVFWTEAARSDLFSIIDPLRTAAPKRADQLITRLMNAAQQLASFPESGRRPPELLDLTALREVVVEQLRLIYQYRPEAQRVEVIAVFHSRRDIPELLRTRLRLP